LLHLLLKDILLCRAPAGAAPFHWPMRHRPTLFVEDALPAHDVRFAEMTALHHLAPDLRRERCLEEGAHLVAERDLVGREAQVHGRLSLPAREGLAGLGEPREQRRRLPQLAVLPVEFAYGVVDLANADRIRVVHGSAAPAREAEAVEPHDIDV